MSSLRHADAGPLTQCDPIFVSPLRVTLVASERPRAVHGANLISGWSNARGSASGHGHPSHLAGLPTTGREMEMGLQILDGRYAWRRSSLRCGLRVQLGIPEERVATLSRTSWRGWMGSSSTLGPAHDAPSRTTATVRRAGQLAGSYTTRSLAVTVCATLSGIR